MRVSMTPAAEKRLKEMAEAEKDQSLRKFRIKRIFPGCGVCGGKLFLSLVQSEPGEDDICASVSGLDFIASPQLLFTAGDSFEVDISDKGLFLVAPLGMLEEEEKQKFCMRPR